MSFQLNRVEEAIEDIRQGKIVLVFDDVARENEGDFIAAAELVTPEIINFMAKYGRGLICLSLQEGKAKELATNYADQYLKGFKVDRVLPFTGRFRTMYSVELKNDAGEVRTLHVNPFGNVMPFGGPWRRGSSRPGPPSPDRMESRP